MIPSFLTRLALGVITIMTGQIMSLTAWIPGSAMIQGNLFVDTTNNATTSVYSNTLQALTLPSHVNPGVGFITNGDQTGITLLDGAAVGYMNRLYPCTATGGLGGKYATCVVNSPYTTSGALVSVALECGGTALSVTGSGGFVKTATAPVLSSFNRMTGITVNTGATVNQTFTGSTIKIWNNADKIKLALVGSIPNGTNFNCGLRVNSYDLYGK